MLSMKLDSKDFQYSIAELLSFVEDKSFLETFAEKVVQTAKQVVPVDTGRLRASISFKIIKNGVEIYADTEYAAFVEYGTVKMQAQPYMSLAIDENKRLLERLINEGIRERV